MQSKALNRQRVVGAGDDDLKLLIAKRFIIPFESGIVVIKHWKIHNYIQKDRYKETMYQDEKKLLAVKGNGSYTVLDTDCIQNGYSLETQVRLGETRLGEDRLDKDSSAAVAVFNQNIHPITPFEFEKLNDWLKDLPSEVVIEAINEAVSANVRKWSYINGILTNWQNDGITTIDAVNARRRERSDRNDRTTNNSRTNNGKSEIDWSKFEFQSKD